MPCYKTFVAAWIKVLRMVEKPQAQPNFVLILTDDQGYGDLSCMGATDFATPHLDRLATHGARFTSWYANSPVCSPSRAALLTGRYPARAGVRSILGGHRRSTGLPPEMPTLGSVLRRAGYRTGIFGKWHLGVCPGARPECHGFDDTFGHLGGCIDYYSHIFYWGLGGGCDPVHDLWENGREIWENGRYFTELVVERAVGFIQRAVAAGRPFFLYVPFNAPHYPMHAPRKYLDRFPHLPWDRQIMAAMISAVDDGVGEIVAALERYGVLRQTCIFYTSDNGPSRESRNWLDNTPDPYYGGSTGKLKGHKFSLYEGGIRVPALMHWPERIPAGQVIHEPAASFDIFPTWVRLAGLDPTVYGVDGCDILPMVTQGASSPHERIFWEMGEQTAVRQGRWKLVLNGQLVEGAPVEDAVHLADLEEDMGERRNVKDVQPGIARDLTIAAQAWRADLERCWEAAGYGKHPLS